MSRDNHVQATWHESDLCDRIQICHVSKPQKALDMYQTLSSFWGWGVGTRHTHNSNHAMRMIKSGVLHIVMAHACIGLPVVTHDILITVSLQCVSCVPLT